MPIISIIIPVFKAEDYLGRCIDSIIRQSFTDFEVLLIDDGSPDRSGEICDEYCVKDKRVRVFHLPHQGVSVARQLGVEKAKGQFSIHIDPDDWVDDDFLELLYNKAVEEQADMVVCDIVKEFDNNSVIVSHSDFNRHKLLDAFLCKYQASCWNKLIRHDIYRKYGISFPVGVQRWEDLYVICSILMHDVKVVFIDKPLYHYDLHINSNSLARFVNIEKVESQIYVSNFFYDKLKGTAHENAANTLRVATKNLSYAVYDVKEYVQLYADLNPTIIRNGVRYKDGISGFFYAATLLTKSRIPQWLYRKMHK